MTIIKHVRHWIPAAFCAFIVYEYIGRGSTSSENWKYVSMWLTICFFYVGGVTYMMQAEIEKLRFDIQQFRVQKQDSHEI
jgi:hypothetical protein